MALILPDVNVLVYAAAADMPEHASYADWLDGVRTSETLGLADAALLGFVRIVTDRRLFNRPLLGTQALDFIGALRDTPRAIRIDPTEATWARLRGFASADRTFASKVVPDAWLAALAISHGARLATADRGFARFDGLDWFDPAQV